MTVDRLLGILSFALGIPGTLILFLTDHEALAVMSLLLGFVLLVVCWVWFWLPKLPPFTFLTTELHLRLEAPKAKTGLIEKHHKIRPNHPHLTSLTHRHIASDGVISDFCWDGVRVPDDRVHKEMGEYEVEIKFDVPLQRLKPFMGKLSYTLTDSFPADTEGVVYFVDFPSKTTKIVVDFPPDRLCRRAYAFKVTGAGRTVMEDPVRTEDGSRISIELKRPIIGSEYHVMWVW